jgi:uncharacterized membrane protein
MLEDVKISNNGVPKSENACFKCGAVLDSDAEFCDECGAVRTVGNAGAAAETLVRTQICPRCGRAAESDEMFCTNCAFDLSKPVMPLVAPVAFACPGCRKNYNDGDKFCRHCAFDLSSLQEKVSSSQFCTNCGKGFGRDDSFCRHCSFDLTSAKHTVVMQTVKPDASMPAFSTPAAQNVVSSAAAAAVAPPMSSPSVISSPPVLSPAAAATTAAAPEFMQAIRRDAPGGFYLWISPLGAAIAVISFFLPWVSGSIKLFGYNAGGMAFSGADLAKFDGSLWLFPLAGVVGIGGFLFCRTQSKVSAARPIVAGSAIFAFVFMFIKLITIQQQLRQIPDLGLAQYNSGLDVQPQIGIFGLVLGFLACLVGTVFLAKPGSASLEPEISGLSSSTEFQAHQASIKPNVAGALSYGAGFILGILWLPVPIFFLLKSPYKTNQSLRFHAFQAILLVVGLLALTLIHSVLFNWMLATPSISSSFDQRQSGIVFLSFLYWAIYLGQIILTVFCAYKAYKNEEYKLPIIGDWAVKWARNGLKF